jgi:3-deoxy-7-phosphoheptulonate synthase
MLQVGTRNTQNFELLKVIGREPEFPVLLKRGFGITLEESLNAAEYLASEGNRRVVFGLRGMKTNMGDPHRNFIDFAHVPVVHRLTRMPVCIDPSHSVGTRDATSEGILGLPAPTWCWSTSIPTPARRWSMAPRHCTWMNLATSSRIYALPARLTRTA